ncbi:hypothetical protein ACWC4J_04675 [Streptomyces sp. NPDC001356]
MADNVARIIAGASAAFTASSMAISYATYRRGKHRLVVGGKFGHATILEPEESDTSYYLTIYVRNHGQTAVKIKELRVELGDGFIEHLRRPSRRSCHIWFPSLPADSAMEVDAFGGVRWMLTLDDMDLSLLKSGKSHLRIAVELPSGVLIHGRWMRTPDWLPAGRSTRGDGQLSFDDLGS